MKLTHFFIDHPRFAAVISIFFTLFGLAAMVALPIAQYPNIVPPTIQITTAYPGASADTVARTVATPLEQAINGVENMDYIASQSTGDGNITITVTFKIGSDVNLAQMLTNNRVQDTLSRLPDPVQRIGVKVQKVIPAYLLGIFPYSPHGTRSVEYISNYMTLRVKDEIARLPGVGGLFSLGERQFAMRIWMKPDRMAALNISPAQVRNMLARNNYLSAVGSTKGSLLQVNLTANTDLHTVDDFKKLVIRQEKGNLVRLSDIADVELGAEDYNTEVRFSGQKAVFMGIYVLPNANAVDVIKRVRAEMEQIQRELPAGMKGEIAYDATAYINDAIHEVVKTLIDTLLIVMVVIFLFLGSIRSVVVPVVAIPISLIGALFLMQLFGFSLNLLTLLAIVLSVGLVVDDAIVVVENVERHLRDGMSRMNAALVGARELIGPIIAMTITLAAVYTPIALQGGLTGALFREFALTLAGAVFISGVVARLNAVSRTRAG